MLCRMSRFFPFVAAVALSSLNGGQSGHSSSSTTHASSSPSRFAYPIGLGGKEVTRTGKGTGQLSGGDTKGQHHSVWYNTQVKVPGSFIRPSPLRPLAFHETSAPSSSHFSSSPLAFLWGREKEQHRRGKVQRWAETGRSEDFVVETQRPVGADGQGQAELRQDEEKEKKSFLSALPFPFPFRSRLLLFLQPSVVRAEANANTGKPEEKAKDEHANVLTEKPSALGGQKRDPDEVKGAPGGPSGDDPCPSPSSAVVRRVEGLRLPSTDKRHYRHVWLSNGLQALLVSDPEAEMSACSVDVHAGHFQDPWEIPGLAHFHEHMLFLGTEKFPDEAEYKRFINSHGGRANGFTSTENTNFYFQVGSDFLEGALDRFSQFFVAPLFAPSCVSREMNAVDSEFRRNLMDDTRRMFMLTKSMANPRHPFSKFSTGSLETLGGAPSPSSSSPSKKEEVSTGTEKVLKEKEGAMNETSVARTREAMREFNEKHFRAENMKLCVLGKEPIDQLEQMVASRFTQVPSGYDRALRDLGDIPPFEFGRQGRLFKVLPLKTTHRLQLTFPLPLDVVSAPNKPMALPASVLGYEGAGSLRSLLAKEDLAEGVSTSLSYSFEGMTLFRVTVDLTERGRERREETLKRVFQKVELLKKGLREELAKQDGKKGRGKGEQEKENEGLERVWDDMRNCRETHFKYAEKGDAS
eukprot:Cvel_28490.t1-p1 / transcript=Cvel_28490.t1 / gene=Cvel_28490 / organism=Chromera_velia_CCMP2878 / gene_product=Insulin-degrading enzyme, putative / transcript_product=Insulin-degrading enzyme, putative / location=Cvel_scaffold3740:117-3524(-) / protein_length=692 / sequence_SO=supercontig / SO=protein_coding / is_pseudo=false